MCACRAISARHSHLDDTAYTYAYVNKTARAPTSQQTAADIANGITEGNGTIVDGVQFPNDVPGYTKQNAYRVWGDILRLSRRLSISAG